MTIDVFEMQTFAGQIRIAVENDAVVRALEFERDVTGEWPVLLDTTPQNAANANAKPVLLLRDYFDGDIGALDRIEVRADGSAFQHRVWDALRRIPPGETCSYAAIARDIGAPNATRAVGTANGSNPIAIIVPCHRVVRSDGTLGGYAGGLDRKRSLLDFECAHAFTLRVQPDPA